uniref:ankyrin repeat domain-containing protein 7-like isoform X2 n=1 Tax=Myxine glutinosa TaxID=7769 RepID=UPI00358E4E5E
MKKLFGIVKKKKGFTQGGLESGSLDPGSSNVKEKGLGKLHKAASTGDLPRLRCLTMKYDVNLLDKDHRTPLHMACVSGRADVVTFLMGIKSIDVNARDSNNRSALFKAVQCQHEACAFMLLEHGADANMADDNGNTALHLTALIPSTSVAISMLQHKANIDAQNKDGSTPLHLAVIGKHFDIFQLLLNERANGNLNDKKQRTPLMIAASDGHIDFVKVLLGHRVDINMKDGKGMTAEDLAEVNGHHGCAHLINEERVKLHGSVSPCHTWSPSLPPCSIQLPGPALDKGTDEPSQSDTLSRSEEKERFWGSSNEDISLDLSPQEVTVKQMKKMMILLKKLLSPMMRIFLSGICRLQSTIMMIIR